MTSPTDPDTVIADIWRLAAAGTLPLSAPILQLLGAAIVNQARLAAAEAVFPGITHLTDHGPGELTAYRAQANGIPYGTFTTREAARACAETVLRQHRPLAPGLSTGWAPESGDTGATEELMLFGPGQDDEDGTGVLVTPLTVSVLYDPDAEG
ncbi:hypothetical protein OHA84_37830 (plasmid) [Streptomyces sp. NBC_00513]|uniref:hypothetical protein n=1 Tax=unclassified Streptomyces TaxID=2593676 RepID=UPI0022568DA6|nr:hypothetical protein [Streptomyces sp. NBC_00424]MCX5078786.1 hypothetical protein [Streptomyces sp. NBC_00424]WUD46293.1 hypothetical protein OHA84_37830 [Streptomyces sp. NBC_00513]